MASWIGRTVVSAPQNASNTHTVAFTPARAGSLLVCVVEGAVTSTTPDGWTLPPDGAAVSSTGLYVWHKVATAGEASLTTTHNASNYAVGFVIYEFNAGSTFVKSATGTNATPAGPGATLTGLTGTNTTFGAVGVPVPYFTEAPNTTWSGTPTPIEDVDINAPRTDADGYILSVAAVDENPNSSFAPTGAVVGGSTGNSKESLAFAVKAMVGNPPTVVTIPVAVAVGTLRAPTLSAGGAVLSSPPAIKPVAVTSAPVVTAGQSVSGDAPASGSATALNPVVTGARAGVITVSPAIATWQALPPSMGPVLAGLVTAVASFASAITAPPTLSAGVHVTGKVMGAVASMRKPSTGEVTPVFDRVDAEVIAYMVERRRFAYGMPHPSTLRGPHD